MSEVTISKLDERIKEIEVAFEKVTRTLVQARDEQIRLRGEFDGLKKLKDEVEKKDEVKDG